MKIRRFIGSKVHGYLNLDVSFNDNLTFLTGINGSGKTTVVRGISALISPSLLTLANISYQSIAVELDVDGQQIAIKAMKKDGQLVLSASGSKNNLTINILTDDTVEPQYRFQEKLSDYYREIEATQGNHPVLQIVKSLPTPMLLGIERRSGEPAPDFERGYSYRTDPRRRLRNIFSTFLSMSLLEAASLAEHNYRKVQAQQRTITEELRKNLIIGTFRYAPFKGTGRPPKISSQDLEKNKKILLKVSKELGLTETEVERDVNPLFDKFQKISESLPSKDIDHILKGNNKENQDLIVEWIMNKPQFDRLTETLGYFEKYTKDIQKVNELTSQYIKIINSYLKDSNKALEFDETGYLCVSIKDHDSQPVTSLSSGESQIVVIITHLAFNPAAQRANVFIVDEPELSLHLRWQELFVDSIQAVNPDLQVILATHSPSIILDKVEYCKDLRPTIS